MIKIFLLIVLLPVSLYVSAADSNSGFGGAFQSLIDFSTVIMNFFTIAVPLAVAFLLLAYICKFFLKRPSGKFYLLLLAPLVLLQVYFLLQAPAQLNVVVPMLPRFVLLAVCLYFLVSSNKSANA